MRFITLRPLLLPCAILLFPALLFAQEAVLTGTITDATGAVLPGVTVDGVIGMTPQTGSSDYRGLQTVFRKRKSNHWQGSITYTLSGLWTKDPPPLSGTDFKEVTFKVAPDIAGERTLGATDQRHRAVFNGIWQVGRGFQVSGIYFYGSGLRSQIVCGCDARGLQIGSIDRLRLNDPQGPNGSISPRDTFVGTPLHGKAALDGSVEVFNLFNRANIQTYNLTETNPNYKRMRARTSRTRRAQCSSDSGSHSEA
jgi:hypothetical protein